MTNKPQKIVMRVGFSLKNSMSCKNISSIPKMIKVPPIVPQIDFVPPIMTAPRMFRDVDRVSNVLVEGISLLIYNI
mgnify:CR=1 FL=1